MAIKVFRGMSPWYQLIFAAFVTVVSFLIIFFISVLTAIPFWGFDGIFSTMSGSMDSPEAINLLKYFQTVQSFGLFILPPFIIAYLYEGQIFRYLKLNKKLPSKIFLLAFAALIVFMPFIGWIGEINSKLSLPEWLGGVEEWMKTAEDNAAYLINKFMDVSTFSGLLFNIFMIAVLPALGEELLFRGVIQKILTTLTKNHHWGIWIAALLFSAMHMQFYGFVPRLLLGGFLGYLLVWSKSLWLPIACHFLNNFIGVMALHLQNQPNEQMAKAGEFAESFSVSWIVALFSLAITIMILMVLKKETEKPAS